MSDTPTPPNTGWNDPHEGTPTGGQPVYGQSSAPYGQQPGYAEQSGYPGQPEYPTQPGYAQQPYQKPSGYQGGPDPAQAGGYPQPAGASSPEDLTLPLYGASFGTAIKRFYKSYARFSGRASRSEYWWVALYQGIIGLILGGVSSAGAIWFFTTSFPGVEGSQILYDDGNYYYQRHEYDPNGAALTLMIVAYAVLMLWALAHLVPNIALAWRRLHDANFAGPFVFLNFSGIGGVVVLVMTLMPSRVEGQRFDPGASPQPGAPYQPYPPAPPQQY